MFPLLFTLLDCPRRTFIGMGRSLTTTDRRMLRSSSPHPSQTVQLQMAAPSCLTFTLLSLKEACSCKPIATCDLVIFLQGDRDSTGTEEETSPFLSLLCRVDKAGSLLWPVPEEGALVNLVRARRMSFSFITHVLLARAASSPSCARSVLLCCLPLIVLETRDLEWDEL